MYGNCNFLKQIIIRKKYHFKLILFFSLVFLLTKNLSAQSKQELSYTFYNIGIGGLFGGIGSVINKNPEEKFGKVFLKGLAQGALGGYIVHQSKNFNRLIYKKRELGYSWPAKIINSAGVSIIENAALNRNFWEQWNLHIGFNRIEFHTKKEFKVKYKVRPASLLISLFSAWDRKLELGYSLKSGNLIFSGKTYPWRRFENPMGSAFGTVIVINYNNLKNDQFYSTMTHELIHVLQYEDFNAINSLIHKPVNNLRYELEELDFLNSIIYPDLQLPFFGGIYLLENHNVNSLNDYYNNHFEHEARHYSKSID